MELELPRLLAPDLPSLSFSKSFLTSTHLNIPPMREGFYIFSHYLIFDSG